MQVIRSSSFLVMDAARLEISLIRCFYQLHVLCLILLIVNFIQIEVIDALDLLAQAIYLCFILRIVFKFEVDGTGLMGLLKTEKCVNYVCMTIALNGEDTFVGQLV